MIPNVEIDPERLKIDNVVFSLLPSCLPPVMVAPIKNPKLGLYPSDGNSVIPPLDLAESLGSGAGFFKTLRIRSPTSKGATLSFDALTVSTCACKMTPSQIIQVYTSVMKYNIKRLTLIFLLF